MAGIPTPTQVEINTAKTNLATGTAPPVYANDGSGSAGGQAALATSERIPAGKDRKVNPRLAVMARSGALP
jgi:hypothetical protein